MVQHKKKVLPEEVQKYLKEIEKFPDLSLKKEKELFKKIEKDDVNAKKELTRSYLKLVVKIAHYYTPKIKKLTLLDLIQDGNLGLFRAVDMYDWKSHYKFSTFATILIRKSILRVLEEKK